MLGSRIAVAKAEQRSVKRDYAVLVFGMAAAIATTLIVIGGTLVGA